MNDGENDIGHLKKKSARGSAWRMSVNGQGNWVWGALGSHPCCTSAVQMETTSLSVSIALQFCFSTFCSLTQVAMRDLWIKISPLLKQMPKSLGLLKCSGRRFVPNKHSSIPREFVQRVTHYMLFLKVSGWKFRILTSLPCLLSSDTGFVKWKFILSISGFSYFKH